MLQWKGLAPIKLDSTTVTAMKRKTDVSVCLTGPRTNRFLMLVSAMREIRSTHNRPRGWSKFAKR